LTKSVPMMPTPTVQTAVLSGATLLLSWAKM
jgi:hypothetical protein